MQFLIILPKLSSLPVDPIWEILHGCKVDLVRNRAISGEINLIEEIKAPIFLKLVVAIEIM